MSSILNVTIEEFGFNLLFCFPLPESGVELLTASNFCIWKNTVLRCGCASKIPMVIETTVAFNKTGVPNAVALEVKVEMGSNLTYILANILAW